MTKSDLEFVRNLAEGLKSVCGELVNEGRVLLGTPQSRQLIDCWRALEQRRKELET